MSRQLSRGWLRVLAPILVLALAGCADSGDDGRANPTSTPTTTATAPGEDPAERFLAALAEEHSEATQLSILLSDTAGPTTDREVDALAGEIEETVEARLEAALAEFELPPSAFAEPSGGAVQRLAAAGPDIHRTFLELMVDNHRRTVTAAQAYLAEGTDPDLRDLADEVATELGERITRMMALLEQT